MKKNKKKVNIVLFIAVAGLAAGLCLLLYPLISDVVCKIKVQEKITSMTSGYQETGEIAEKIRVLLYQARLYNSRLAGHYYGDESKIYEYDRQLSLDDEPGMSILEIPKISLKMIVYHGTSDEVLAVGAGHHEKSSLPVGGSSTHAVITGHSGLKNTRAFDMLRKLVPGDTFSITTLGKKLEYEVTSVETVLPEETDSLRITDGEDLVTLVTCTPYGVNDHRLFVHASRKNEI